MEYGFALGSRVLVGKNRSLPIQILRPGDIILSFVMGRLFPVTVRFCYQRFINKVQVTKTDNIGIRGGLNQPIYQYNGYKELCSLEEDDILLKQNQEPVRVKETKLCEICMPVYVLQTYPDLSFIVNGFVVGSPGFKGEYCEERT